MYIETDGSHSVQGQSLSPKIKPMRESLGPSINLGWSAGCHSILELETFSRGLTLPEISYCLKFSLKSRNIHLNLKSEI